MGGGLNHGGPVNQNSDFWWWLVMIGVIIAIRLATL